MADFKKILALQLLRDCVSKPRSSVKKRCQRIVDVMERAPTDYAQEVGLNRFGNNLNWIVEFAHHFKTLTNILLWQKWCYTA